MNYDNWLWDWGNENVNATGFDNVDESRRLALQLEQDAEKEGVNLEKVLEGMPPEDHIFTLLEDRADDDVQRQVIKDNF